MPEPDFVELFVEPLDRLGLTYMVTGSVASMRYAEPRFTADFDLVRRRVPVESRDVWVAPPEYVVLRKLLFFREGGSSNRRLVLPEAG